MRSNGSASALEARRRLAVQRVLSGQTQAAVAKVLGVHTVTVAKWMARGNNHKGPLMREFLKTAPRLHLEMLPPWAPELNPVEPVWSWLKHGELANYVPDDTDMLDHEILDRLISLKFDPELLRALWNRSDLPREGGAVHAGQGRELRGMVAAEVEEERLIVIEAEELADKLDGEDFGIGECGGLASSTPQGMFDDLMVEVVDRQKTWSRKSDRAMADPPQPEVLDILQITDSALAPAVKRTRR